MSSARQKNNSNARIDALDKKILKILQEKGRITNAELARANNLAPSSMLERIKRLEEQGFIKGYRATLSAQKLGYNIQALISINLVKHRPESVDKFESAVRGIPEVKACYHLTGRFDYLLHILARDIEHLRELLTNKVLLSHGVDKAETFLILSEVKEDSGAPINGE
ncbi:MAG: leucine-responsive transcriptional regulator Lrp [Myxococcota bacterium]